MSMGTDNIYETVIQEAGEMDTKENTPSKEVKKVVHGFITDGSKNEAEKLTIARKKRNNKGWWA